MSREVLGGVAYVPIGASTVEHDVWIMGRIKAAGISEVEVRPGETADDWAKRLLFSLSATGHATELLGAVMVPETVGPDGWTPDVARATSAHLAGIRDADEKAIVFELLIANIMSFFRNGLVSVWSSPTS